MYCSDLDGTLLDQSGSLSKFSGYYLKQMLVEGIPFTVASARSLVSMKECLGELPFTLPVIEFNGAYISDYHTGRKLVTHAIDTSMVIAIQKVMRKQEVIHFVSSHDGMNDHVYYGPERNGGMDYYLTEREAVEDPRLRLTLDWSEIEREEVVCFTAVDIEEPMRQLRDALQKEYGDDLTMHLWDDTYATGWYWLMVHHRDACKGKAISRLMESRGMADHQLTVFGDQVNDLGMMEVAHRKVAVANACPEILEVADLILEPNYKDSVTEFILQDWQSADPLLK